MKLTVILVLGLFLAIENSAIAAEPQQTNLAPAVLGTANDSDFDGQWDTYWHQCCLAYNGLPDTYNYRVAVEFDLSFIPNADSLHSATFYIRWGLGSGWPDEQLQFNSYAGDGVLDFDDFEQINEIALLNNFSPNNGTEWYKVPATAAAKSILSQNGGYLGLMIQNTKPGQTLLSDPYLAITYVPEPTTLAVMSVFALIASATDRQLRASRTLWVR